MLFSPIRLRVLHPCPQPDRRNAPDPVLRLLPRRRPFTLVQLDASNWSWPVHGHGREL